MNTTTNQLIERLRTTASKGVSVWGDLQIEAANEIETLAAERDLYASSMDRMKVALEAQAKQIEALQAKLSAIEKTRHLVGYYHRAETADECDFYFLDAINGDCPDCHPCYADTTALEKPVAPAQPVLEKLREYVLQHAPDCPAIEKAESWEQLYALVTTLEGIKAANNDLHRLLDQPVNELVEALELPENGAYLICYDDTERSNELFARTGARTAAIQRYKQISDQWNAHLYVKIGSNSRDESCPSAKAAQPPKDHEVAKMVSDLTQIANSYHDHQSLRQRISNRVLETVKASQPDDSAKSGYHWHLVLARLIEAEITKGQQ